MKLWLVAQWGNIEEGPDGSDTQCIVSASSLEEAIKVAEEMFSNILPLWRDGKCDVVNLLGKDYHQDQKPKVVIRVWKDHALNLGNHPTWIKNTLTNKFESVF